MERVRIFLVVNGGLLAFYGLLVAQIKDSFCALSVAALFFPLLAAVNVYVTWRMSKRAHMFILLRKTQGMLIEKKIKTLLAQDKPWRTCSGIVTTFTREHTVFLDEKNMSPEWEPLREEIRNLCCRKEGRDYVAGPFGQAWIGSSMGHLTWLQRSFWGVAIIWTIVLGVSALFVIEKNAPKVRAWLKPERGWRSPHSREGQHPVREAPPGRRHRVRPLEDGREGGHDPHTRRRGGPPLRPHGGAPGGSAASLLMIYPNWVYLKARSARVLRPCCGVTGAGLIACRKRGGVERVRSGYGVDRLGGRVILRSGRNLE